MGGTKTAIFIPAGNGFYRYEVESSGIDVERMIVAARDARDPWVSLPISEGRIIVRLENIAFIKETNNVD